MSDKPLFTLPIRIYYEDTDTGGLVYHANYLKFMERARTDFLRSIGCEHQSLMAQKSMFVVVDCALSFKRSAQLDDLIHITEKIESISKVKLIFQQQVWRDGALLCEGRFVIASVHSETLRPIAIPEKLRNKYHQTK